MYQSSYYNWYRYYQTTFYADASPPILASNDGDSCDSSPAWYTVPRR